MRAPAFWWERLGLRALLLWPIGAVYGWLTARRMARPGARPPLPMICVGNFVVGGAGKTPTAIALAEIAAKNGLAPCFLTRGYGGRLKGPVRVDPAIHGAADVGDEALLLAAVAPTIVSRRRERAFDLLKESGASLCFMDDGLQNPSIAKTMSLAVVDGAVGIGNGLSLPAGPMRAPLRRQIGHADVVLVYGSSPRAGKVIRAAARRGRPVLRASVVQTGKAIATGTRVYAFSGIGRPAKFFDQLREAGIEVAGTRSFADHHLFSNLEAKEILAEAERLDARPVTTEKDAVRLRGRSGPAAELYESVVTLGVETQFENPIAVAELLKAARARWLRDTFEQLPTA
ncbi:tetraacyldisaccharide 4'-kinase [Oryzibacter oryziterrae]|uniref:tetraacyldisaccharide 4'-kinase n=1 Tax=Oryzibacter oryziterrae TaxID=2766474 RepID=UPI001F01CDF5|nr:tetraacyldisaccharide 4'-kinase [Oryzibacter oryziterrae]